MVVHIERGEFYLMCRCERCKHLRAYELSKGRASSRSVTSLGLEGRAKKMIKVRIQVRNETGSFTAVVHAENLREAARIAKDRYPESAVEIAFPIEPTQFFAAGPGPESHVDSEGAGAVGTRRRGY
jgi:hypothetical protein